MDLLLHGSIAIEGANFSHLPWTYYPTLYVTEARRRQLSAWITTVSSTVQYAVCLYKLYTPARKGVLAVWRQWQCGRSTLTKCCEGDGILRYQPLPQLARTRRCCCGVSSRKRVLIHVACTNQIMGFHTKRLHLKYIITAASCSLKLSGRQQSRCGCSHQAVPPTNQVHLLLLCTWVGALQGSQLLGSLEPLRRRHG